jgi:hypothetical protein
VSWLFLRPQRPERASRQGEMPKVAGNARPSG